MARLLHISQPAASQLLKDLEEQLGFELFYRARGRSQMTAEALALLPEVERLFAQMATVKGRAAELRDTRSGSLSVASVPTVFSELLPRALASFQADYENVLLKVGTFSAAQVVQQVRYDTADIGIAFLPVDTVGVEVEPLMTMHVVCVVPTGHRLARRSVVTVKDFDGELLIAQGPQSPPGLILRESIKPTSTSTMRILETNQSTSALQMARHGLGIALVHPLTLSTESPGAEAAIAFEPVIELTLGVIYSRQRAMSRTMHHFLEHLRSAAAVFAEAAAERGLVCTVVSKQTVSV